MQESIRLVLSGGGTAGHIMPNIALIRELKNRHKNRLQILYIGEADSMEQKLLASNFPDDPNIKFKAVKCGKLRRYFSINNFLDFFMVPIGSIQAAKAIKSFKPRAIFCKGGYVSFPVAFGGWMAKIPVILHESDVIPGLTNKLCARFAKKICVSFDESKKFFDVNKIVVTGNLVRPEIAEGNKEHGKKFAGLKENLPVILVMGGSQGADFINKIIWENLVFLLNQYQIVHICGENKVKGIFSRFERYKAFDFVGPQLRDLYALADLIISRAGAMSLAEIDLVNKPALLIPLGKKASRGDQIINAKVFAKDHVATILEEENYNQKIFLAEIEKLLSKRPQMSPRPQRSIEQVINLLVNP